MFHLLSRTGAKLAIGGGAVYATVSQGVWSTSNQSSTALKRFRTTVVPTTNEYIEKVFIFLVAYSLDSNKYPDQITLKLSPI